MNLMRAWLTCALDESGISPTEDELAEFSDCVETWTGCAR